MTHGRKNIRPYGIAQMEGRWKRREGNKSIRSADGRSKKERV
jgi:hypothetical protein